MLSYNNNDDDLYREREKRVTYTHKTTCKCGEKKKETFDEKKL